MRTIELQQTVASTSFAVILAGEVDPINPAAVWSFPHYNAFAS